MAILREHSVQRLLRSIYDFFAFSADPYFIPIVEGLVLNSYGFNTFTAKQHHIRPMDWRFALEYPALPILSVRFRMPFDDIDILDQKAILFSDNLKDFSDLAFVLAGNDFHLVVFFYLDTVSNHFLFSTGQDGR
jgi:hypothetical protein